MPAFPLLLGDRSATVLTYHIQAQPHHTCSSLLSRHHPTGASQGTLPFLWSVLSYPQFPRYFSSDFNLPLAKQKQWWENTVQLKAASATEHSRESLVGWHLESPQLTLPWDMVSSHTGNLVYLATFSPLYFKVAEPEVLPAYAQVQPCSRQKTKNFCQD